MQRTRMYLNAHLDLLVGILLIKCVKNLVQMCLSAHLDLLLGLSCIKMLAQKRSFHALATDKQKE
jgi:hypothetical protein